MKHLILTTDFKPKPGGIAEYFHRLALELSKDDSCHVLTYGLEQGGHDSSYDVTYLKGRDRALGEHFGDCFAPFRAVNSFLHSWGAERLEATSMLEDFFSRASDEEVRVYIGVWSEQAHFWCQWLRRRGIPYFLFAHGAEIIREAAGPLQHQFMEDFRGADAVFANSEGTAGLVTDMFDVDVCIAHPGVSEPDIAQDADVADLQLDLDIPADTPVVLSLCRLVERKGLAKVLRALSSQELRSTDFHYVIAGSGPQLSHLRELTEELDLTDRVDFVGFVDEQAKWKLYELADLFVMPNSELGGQDWEGFGIVFLEAAIMGTPAIAGRSGGATEAVAHGDTGYTVDPNSPTELQQRLLELLEHADRRAQMGRAARQRAKEEFRWEETARKVAEYG